MKIHDVTLREGEQQTGVVFTRDDKVEIAKKLAELGVDRIEAGMPAVSQQDADAVKAIVDLNLGPEIFAFCRCMASDIEMAKKAGCKGATLEIACNPLFVEKAYGKSIDWAKKAAIEATIAAKELGLYVSFFTIDGTRTEIDVLLDIVDEIHDQRAHGRLRAGRHVRLRASAVGVPDHFEGEAAIQRHSRRIAHAHALRPRRRQYAGGHRRRRGRGSCGRCRASAKARATRRWRTWCCR